jgi:hypothetical protein
MHDPTVEKDQSDEESGVEAKQNSVDVDVIELRLPCRSFRISYKVAEPGDFSLTTEFLMRLLRLVDGLSESSVSEFFGFTNDETQFVIDRVENQGFARRTNGKIYLTDAGHGLFVGGDEPALFEVHSKQERFEFDLIAFAPADVRKVFDDFEFSLPELPMAETLDGERASDRVFQAFKRFFQEFRLKRSGSKLEKQGLYTIDQVQAELRFSTLIPVTLSVRIDEPGFPEASLLNWRSGTELEDRGAVVQQCANFAKEIRFRSDQVSEEAVDLMVKSFPVHMMGLYKAKKLNAEAFFKATMKQVGELRVDRPTVRTVGQLWTDANRVRFASALRYAMTKSTGAPAMQIWLRPSVPHWGITKRISDLLSAVERQFTEGAQEEAKSLKSVMIGDDRRHVPFKHMFNGVINLPLRDFPSGLEIFLIPGHIAYVALHTPLGQPEGYPVPLGILSFEREAVARVEAAVLDILGSSLATPYHCDWVAKDFVASVRATLQPKVTTALAATE